MHVTLGKVSHLLFGFRSSSSTATSESKPTTSTSESATTSPSSGMNSTTDNEEDIKDPFVPFAEQPTVPGGESPVTGDSGIPWALAGLLVSRAPVC